MAVAAAPAEGLALGGLETGEVDAAGLQRRELLHRVVAADHADELHAGLVRGRGGEVVGRTAEDFIGLAERSLDGIEGDGTDDEHAHLDL